MPAQNQRALHQAARNKIQNQRLGGVQLQLHMRRHQPTCRTITITTRQPPPHLHHSSRVRRQRVLHVLIVHLREHRRKRAVQAVQHRVNAPPVKANVLWVHHNKANDPPVKANALWVRHSRASVLWALPSKANVLWVHHNKANVLPGMPMRHKHSHSVTVDNHISHNAMAKYNKVRVLVAAMYQPRADDLSSPIVKVALAATAAVDSFLGVLNVPAGHPTAQVDPHKDNHKDKHPDQDRDLDQEEAAPTGKEDIQAVAGVLVVDAQEHKRNGHKNDALL
jgi:hypothetical protein